MAAHARYFTVEDMRCHSGERYPIEWEDSRLQELFDVIDAVRGHMGEPLVIICGYRSLAYNKALREASLKRNGGTTGVAMHSQHIEGRAVDIRPLKATRHGIDLLHDMALQLYADGVIPSLGGLGRYPSLWCHLDTRPKTDGKLVRWDANGNGNGSDS